MKQKRKILMAFFMVLFVIAGSLSVSAKTIIRKVPRYAVLILDGSGSMTGEPWRIQQEAAIKFCGSLIGSNNENYIAVVEISENSHQICDFTNDLDLLTSAIQKVGDDGGTDITGALRTAKQVLDNIPKTNAKVMKNAILCSDGLPEYGETMEYGHYNSNDHAWCYMYANSAYQAAIELKQEECPIYTLGFFHSLDDEELTFAKRFMGDIQTAGYYDVTDPENLTITFEEVAEEIIEESDATPAEGTVLEYDGSFYEVTKAGETVALKETDSAKPVLIIPDTIEVDGITYKVTSIADGALKNNQTVEKIIIGKNIEVIGSEAFSGCTNLYEIVIESQKLSEIGENAFQKIHPSASIKVRASKLSAYQKLLRGKGQGKKVQVVKDSGKAVSVTISADKKIADRHGAFLDQAVSVKTAADYYRVEVKDADWLKVSAEQTDDVSLGLSKLPSHTRGAFYLLAAENEDEKRSATVMVTDASGKTKKHIKVTQIGSETSYLEVETAAHTFGEKAATGKAVNVLADEDTNWTAAASKKWIKVTESEDAQSKKYASKEIGGTGAFYIYVKANGSYAARSGYVTVSAPRLGTFKIKVTQEANKRQQKALLAELKVGVSKKTFSRSKTSQVKFTYPKGLSKKDVKKVTYSSSKEKVATVTKNGVIKGIRKGKAKILVKVTLKSGVTKTFTLRITVGTRNVSLVQK